MDKKNIQERTPLPPPQAAAAAPNTTTITQEHEIQTQKNPIFSQESPKVVKSAITPDRLKVPISFKYPERYRSPTDLMMSPVSRRLLVVARSRKYNNNGGGVLLLPPHKIQPPQQQQQQPILQIQKKFQQQQETRLFHC